MHDMATIARRIVVRGRVQGVGFRYSMVEAAAGMSVAGWTRNRADGSVEALVQGATADVDRMIEWSRRGPAAARVASVDVTDASVDPALQGFTTRPTV